ncbi:DUF2199 domain-containing protein [Micromonospora sp. WMMD1102]|uniref:DUF2199 domain-containing protein n=1 Tax=Micromonospora sp. WMMD1102 TaxID=3016105 RepID=UPI002415055D|nr:DUF2199 domain-containing protein [Micromonospora sp. WMMD1102]MDG4788449.1 DUF2199 domain-containing protein [Micromonospora sp. WMMD1102]
MHDQRYQCRCCGQQHEGLPFSYGSDAPAYWRDDLAQDEQSLLDDELCIIQAQHFFVRARIVIPVLDATAEFDWTVWVSLSRANFERMTDLWTTPGREREPSYFGWLSSELPGYEPTTLNLKTRVHTRPVGERPSVELEPTDHPLAVEQRTGITLDRVQRFAENLLHPS